MWTSRVEGPLKRVKTGDSHVVDLHVSVVGAGEELLRVRGEGEGADGHGVALERLDDLAGGHLEDVDDAVDGAGGDVLPVGRVRNRQRELAAGVQHLMIRSIRQSSIFLVD